MLNLFATWLFWWFLGVVLILRWFQIASCHDEDGNSWAEQEAALAPGRDFPGSRKPLPTTAIPDGQAA